MGPRGITTSSAMFSINSIGSALCQNREPTDWKVGLTALQLTAILDRAILSSNPRASVSSIGADAGIAFHAVLAEK